MSDENTTCPTTSSAPDLPPEPAEAAPSATTGAKGGGASGLSQTIAKVTPSASTGAGKHNECRKEPRIHVRWHADALIDGQDLHHGFVKDISLNGTDIFLDRNLHNVKFVKLHIHVPPLRVTSERHVVEVSGKVVYTAYDSNESLFHTGVNFLQFNLESDLSYLQSRIANH